MNIFQAGILGIVQGLTEFFPVSSSGHLAILQNYFGSVDVSFDVFLHFATLLAVIAFFSKEIWMIIKDVVLWRKESRNFKIGWFIVLGSIPAGIAGFLLKDSIDYLFSSLWVVACSLVISGMFLFVASFSLPNKNMDWKRSIIIGCAQALALLPGLSRSGSTVSTGVIMGVKREEAVRFSFLLSIPAIMVAIILQLGEIQMMNAGNLAAGFLAAFFSGLFAIFIFLKYIKLKNFRWFAYYCWVLAGIIIFTLLF